MRGSLADPGAGHCPLYDGKTADVEVRVAVASSHGRSVGLGSLRPLGSILAIALLISFLCCVPYPAGAQEAPPPVALLDVAPFSAVTPQLDHGCSDLA
jgi:hypothetical protein